MYNIVYIIYICEVKYFFFNFLTTAAHRVKI